MKKRTLAATLGAVALIAAIGIGSTFAYLTSTTGTVTNTFTVGNVSIDLKESSVERENGTGDYVQVGNLDVDENEYTDIYPGEELYKDPTVIVNDGSMESWLFVQIEYNNAEFEAPEVDTVNYWDQISSKTVGNTVTVVYAYKDTVEAGDTCEVFNKVTFINADADDKVDDITIKAFAIQKSSFATSQAVWDANEVNFGTSN